MINIVTKKGDLWSWDEEKGLIYKNNQVVSSVNAEPVFSEPSNKNNPPVFAGILLKDLGKILTLSGKMNTIVDPNVVL